MGGSLKPSEGVKGTCHHRVNESWWIIIGRALRGSGLSPTRSCAPCVCRSRPASAPARRTVARPLHCFCDRTGIPSHVLRYALNNVFGRICRLLNEPCDAGSTQRSSIYTAPSFELMPMWEREGVVVLTDWNGYACCVRGCSSSLHPSETFVCLLMGCTFDKTLLKRLGLAFQRVFLLFAQQNRLGYPSVLVMPPYSPRSSNQCFVCSPLMEKYFVFCSRLSLTLRTNGMHKAYRKPEFSGQASGIPRPHAAAARKRRGQSQGPGFYADGEPMC